MAKATDNKKVIVDIILQLKSKNEKKVSEAVKKVKDHFGSLRNFAKAATVEYGSFTDAVLKANRLGKKGRISEAEKLRAIQDARRIELNYALQNLKINQELSKEKEKQLRFAKLRGAKLGFNLSLLFFSWTVSRKIGTALRDIQNTYLKITQGQTEYSNLINRTSAAMSFLKFVIFDTFSQNKLVQKMTSAFIELVNVIAEMVASHPKITVGIVIGAMAIKTIADIATFKSQFDLLKDSIIGLKKIGNINLGLNLSQTLVFGGKIVLAAGVALAAYQLGKQIAKLILKGMTDQQKWNAAVWMSGFFATIEQAVNKIQSLFDKAGIAGKILSAFSGFEGIKQAFNLFKKTVLPKEYDSFTEMYNNFKTVNDYIKTNLNGSIDEFNKHLEEIQQNNAFDVQTEKINNTIDKVRELKQELLELNNIYTNLSTYSTEITPHSG